MDFDIEKQFDMNEYVKEKEKENELEY